MLKKLLILFVVATFSVVSCTKDSVSPTPSTQIVGTWKIESAIFKDGSQNLDYWLLASAFYPCVKDITFSFNKDLTFVTNGAATCKDSDGQALSFLPNSGKYAISTTNVLKITDTSNSYIDGSVTFTDGKMKWAVKDSTDGLASTIDVTFVKK